MSEAEGRAGVPFPEADAEATNILVVSDLDAAVDWWCNRVGAELQRIYGGTSAVCRFAGMWLLLVTGGPPTPDKPHVTFDVPAERDRVSNAITVRVEDCQRVHDVLVERGVTFLTPPVTNDYEVRCFTRDPDGHLLEFSQAR